MISNELLFGGQERWRARSCQVFFNRSRDRGGRDFSCLERGTVTAKREIIATEREIVVSKSERERERERERDR